MNSRNWLGRLTAEELAEKRRRGGKHGFRNLVLKNLKSPTNKRKKNAASQGA
jgi:hypothetical protein